jgi:hypothetical protein
MTQAKTDQGSQASSRQEILLLWEALEKQKKWFPRVVIIVSLVFIAGLLFTLGLIGPLLMGEQPLWGVARTLNPGEVNIFQMSTVLSLATVLGFTCFCGVLWFKNSADSLLEYRTFQVLVFDRIHHLELQHTDEQAVKSK